MVEPENPVALAKEILELYQNQSYAEQLGKQGRQYAIERYSFEQALNHYEELFQAVKESTEVVKPAYAPERG